MTYHEFKIEYERLAKTMLSYTHKEAGSKVYAEKLADLVDEYPEFEAIYDAGN